MPSIFISSGEASGDHYAANITRALRRRGFGGDIWGMGASESREAGVRVEWPGEQLQLFGFTEIFSSVPRILRLINEVARRVASVNPDAVAVVDSPDYHMRLIAKIRRFGYRGKIFYVSPPTVWAWRSGRVEILKKYADECFPLYKFEHDFLAGMGAKSYWTGAPLLEEFAENETEIPDELKGDGKIVAFLPGSRRSELSKLLPIMKEVAKETAERGWHPVFSIAPGLAEDARVGAERELKESGFRCFKGPGRELMAAANCSVSASGTVSVESLLLRKYMIVVYKLNWLTGFLAERIIKLRWYTMANILAGEEIYPELLQRYCTVPAVTERLLSYLEGGTQNRDALREKMDETVALLGKPCVYDSWAERITDSIE